MATSKQSGGVGRWLYSTKNMAGVGLAVVGPALGIAGVINPLLGLAIAPALYIVGALAAPGRKKVRLAEGIDPGDAERSLDQIQKRIKGKVPDDVTVRVKHIAATVDDSLKRASALGEGGEDLFGLVRTATDYLPTALQAYLDLPRAYADRKVVSAGKTAKEILCDQLDLLVKKMDEIADDVNRADTDKLIAHGRFLAEKFGKGDGDLDIG